MGAWEYNGLYKIWTGTTSNSWNTGTNWSPSSIPTSTDYILINSGTPQLDIDYTVNSLTISGTGSLTIDPAKTLTIGAGAIVDFGGKSAILKSSVTGTAAIGTITGTLTGASNVTMERYIPARRAWRLISTPLTTTAAPTINTAWQEGVVQTSPSPANNPNDGFGTHITGGTIANGFDQSPTNNPSLKYFNAGAWTGVTATNTGKITDQPGYMLFVRGSRAVDLSAGVNATPYVTVLRPTGTIKQGNQALALNATGYNLVANPYPSAIDMHAIALANSGSINDNFKLWDPKIGGTNQVGGFVTFSWNSGNGNYDMTPDAGDMTGASALSQYIQSSAAFFVDSKVASGNVNVIETNKSTLGDDNVYLTNTTPDERMKINLRSVNADATMPVIDAVLTTYAVSNTNAIDEFDAGKLANYNTENISIRRGTNEFSIERREIINTTDTIFLSISGMAVKNYQLDLRTQLLDHPALTGILMDGFNGAQIPFDLNGNTVYGFSVTADPATFAINRFIIVFKITVPLPVTFTSIKATQQNNPVAGQLPHIAVEWKVDNQMNITAYEVEKSADGRTFSKVTTQLVVGANGTSVTYNWLDLNAFSGNNYYRVRSIGNGGEVKYSTIVNVNIGNAHSVIAVYPNPVINRQLNIQFSGMDKGVYNLRLISASGQSVFVTKLTHTGGSALHLVKLGNCAAGNYRLEIVKPDNSRLVKALVVLN